MSDLSRTAPDTAILAPRAWSNTIPTATFRPCAASRFGSTHRNRWRSPGPAAAARARSCTCWAASIDRPTAKSTSAKNRYRSSISTTSAQQVGFVFQTFYLLPTLTALENIQIPMFEARWSSRERIERASRLIKEVGLADRASHRPNQLSIGQRQRIAIARSLANDPCLLLADEPTGNLDSKSQDEIIQLLHRLRDERQLTLLIVTHSNEVAQAADRRVLMKDGQIQPG